MALRMRLTEIIERNDFNQREKDIDDEHALKISALKQSIHEFSEEGDRRMEMLADKARARVSLDEVTKYMHAKCDHVELCIHHVCCLWLERMID